MVRLQVLSGNNSSTLPAEMFDRSTDQQTSAVGQSAAGIKPTKMLAENKFLMNQLFPERDQSQQHWTDEDTTSRSGSSSRGSVVTGTDECARGH